MKCAIILRGESFRMGGQGSRVIGKPESIAEQLAAARSHIQLAEHIRRLGYEPHIYVTTYRTQFTEQLLDIYRTYLQHSNILEKHLPTQNHLIHAAVAAVPVDNYDCIIIARIDNLFKEQFYREFSIDDKITFISVCWYRHRKTIRGSPRINDMYYQFPKACFRYLRASQANMLSYGHDFIDWISLPRMSYRFMAKYYYDSDSEKDKNPYYRIINRNESNITYSGERLFPEHF